MTCRYCIKGGRHVGINRICGLTELNPYTGEYDYFNPENAYCKAFMILRDLSPECLPTVNGASFEEKPDGIKIAKFLVEKIEGLSLEGASLFAMVWRRNHAETISAGLIHHSGETALATEGDVSKVIEFYRDKEQRK